MDRIRHDSQLGPHLRIPCSLSKSRCVRHERVVRTDRHEHGRQSVDVGREIRRVIQVARAAPPGEGPRGQVHVRAAGSATIDISQAQINVRVCENQSEDISVTPGGQRDSPAGGVAPENDILSSSIAQRRHARQRVVNGIRKDRFRGQPIRDREHRNT